MVVIPEQTTHLPTATESPCTGEGDSQIIIFMHNESCLITLALWLLSGSPNMALTPPISSFHH